MKTFGSRERLLASTIIAGVALAGSPALAQAPASSEAQKAEVVVVTGTRIQTPGVVSSSPINTIGAAELTFQQGIETERLLRNLPITVPGDGENTNNGTAGATTVNLRDLGEARNLILVDGKRLTPYNQFGIVDVSIIPSGMLERVDIVTGGASAVYGSDAISGAVNFILKRDFEGVEIDVETSRTGENDGATYKASAAFGASTDDGRGNVALSLNYSKREGVQFGARPYGIVGVSTSSGAGLGITGAAQPANCGGTNTVPTTFGGSGTTLPARIIMPSFDPDGAGPLPAVSGARQFREDGTLGPNCNQFNFNPYNYYQTPNERYAGLAIGRYEINENVEAYARMMFSATNVRQQIAPSGIFNTPLLVPLQNPFLSAGARADIIAQFEGARRANALTLTGASQNWYDNNANGVVDAADTVRFAVGRRTVEFGERSTTYDNNVFQVLLGVRGTFAGGDWNWDVAIAHGESDRTNISAGYTNVENVRGAVNTISATSCTRPTGGPAEGNQTATCVPLNLFGREGSITPAMAAYSAATALEQQNYKQTYAQATISGPVEMVKMPWSENPLAIALGTEYREETGVTTPDECLKLAPASCLGGAGGNTLPVSGGFSVQEFFGEAILPIATDKALAQALDLELGYRYSDYDPSGVNETWKAGLNWALNDQIRVRVMQQKAVRAPNVNELAGPLRTGLRNATSDPCSVTNAAALAGNATLRALCISTGMTAAQVGLAPDIIAGQINVFQGTLPTALPRPEEADTTTFGIVFTPTFLPALNRPTVSLDYYKIDIDGYIDTFGAQETLNLCYQAGNPAFCSRIIRQGGNLVFPGSGVQIFTTNLTYYRVEGWDLGVNFGLDLDTFGLDSKWGSLSFSYNATLATQNERLSAVGSPVIDCLGAYGNQCGNPSPEYRHTQRTVWNVGDFTFSYLWRYVGESQVETVQRAATFAPFRKIKAHSYVDLTAAYAWNENAEFTFGVRNLLDKDPPIVGGEIASTDANGGNTFPQVYDPVGRIFSLGVNLKF